MVRDAIYDKRVCAWRHSKLFYMIVYHMISQLDKFWLKSSDCIQNMYLHTVHDLKSIFDHSSMSTYEKVQ